MLSGHTPSPFSGSSPEDDPKWRPIADWIKVHRADLDTELPPESGWMVVNQRLRQHRPMRLGIKWLLQTGLVAAASLAMVLGLVLIVKPDIAPASVADIIHGWQFDRNAPAQVRTIDAHYEPKIEKLQDQIRSLMAGNEARFEKQVAKLDKELNSFRAEMKQSPQWPEEKIMEYELLRAKHLTAYQDWLKALEKTPQSVHSAGFSMALYA